MKPWYSPQSRQLNELLRALKNSLAMVGIMACLVAASVWISKHLAEILATLATVIGAWAIYLAIQAFASKTWRNKE